jgi:carboxylesterase type B
MGSSALAAYGEGMGGKGHKYTEDCLGLNIWTKPQTGEKAKAVLFWVHGGGKVFQLGRNHLSRRANKHIRLLLWKCSCTFHGWCSICK